MPSPGTQVLAINPESGPRSIESIYDELLSSPGTLKVALAKLDDFDAFVIACYSDHPTVYALREITDKPVLGIAEASIYLACMLGYKFSVVTTNREWEPLLWDAVRHYGMADRCASVRSTGMPVLALESASPEETYQMILNASQQAMENDGAEVICLGCAGMTGLDKKLEAELRVPVSRWRGGRAEAAGGIGWLWLAHQQATGVFPAWVQRAGRICRYFQQAL